jgi:hypothetical protein
MAYHNGPKIVTDDLVMHLDASNPKSYLGETTVNLLGSQGLTYGVYAYATGPVATSTAIYDNSIATVNRFTVSQVVNTARSAFFPTVSVNQAYTFSCYMRYNGSNTASPSFVISAAKPNPEGGNTIVLSQSTQTQTAAGNGWYRVVYNFTISSNTATACILTIGVSTGSDTAYLNNTFDVYQPQLEAKSYATAYVANTRGATVATGGGFADLSGNGNHCTLTTTGVTTVSTYNGGVALDGSSGYIELPTINNGINRTVDIVYRQINLNGGWGPLWRNDWRERIFTTYATVINAPGTYYSSSGIPDGTTNLQQFSYTIDGLTLRFYRNGVLSTTTTMNGYMNQGSFLYRFGYQCGGSTCTNVAVEIYSVKFYNRGLTATEILQNFNATKSRYGL